MYLYQLVSRRMYSSGASLNPYYESIIDGEDLCFIYDLYGPMY